MALCTGARNTNQMQCNGTLYRCSCGAEGCKQTYPDGCSDQGFDVYGKCLKCGLIGKYLAISDVQSDRAPRKTPALL